jgi:non-ribosomal peptide synthetase component E (peptide arylation enzyme)
MCMREPKRAWTAGSVLIMAALVVLGGTGAAEDVYLIIGRYNVWIVALVAVGAVAMAWRRSRNRPGAGTALQRRKDVQ